MARPSVNDKRSEQILQAYEACIAKFGVHGTTLALIAEESGLSRPLVRHHVGNQSDLLEQSIDRFLCRTEDLLKEAQPGCFVTIDDFLDVLFPVPQVTVHSDTLVASAFIAVSQENKNIRDKMNQWLNDVSRWFCDHVSFYYPQQDTAIIRTTAMGVMGIYFNADSLTPLGEDIQDLQRHSRQAAYNLIRTLSIEKEI